MDRRAISVTLAVVCLTVLLGATGLFAISRETSYMQECASEGFAIDGYYRDDKTSREILAFLEEDGCRWQLVDKDGSCVDGQFKRTDDPNILILKGKRRRIRHGSRCVYIAPTQSGADLPN